MHAGLDREAGLPKDIAIDPKFLELLACPLTKGSLTWDAERSELVSRLAKIAYPVRDGIPVLLPSEARTLDEDETRK
jgi:uncharacterized protein